MKKKVTKVKVTHRDEEFAIPLSALKPYKVVKAAKSKKGAAKGAKLLKKARLDRGWTQEQLANKARTAPTYVSALEKGDKRITPEMAKRLARPLKVDAEDLLR